VSRIADGTLSERGESIEAQELDFAFQYATLVLLDDL